MDIVTKIRRSLDRDRELPLAERLRKGSRYLASAGLAPLVLRGCTAVGPRARTVGLPRISNRGTLRIGRDFTLNSSFCAAELLVGSGAELLLGDEVAINYGTVVAARSRVTIGNSVSLGPYCIVADFELPDRPGEHEALPIEIGDEVWLAGRVTVLPGARIGARSVITAGSVVSGEIPPGVVAGGSPARVLRRVDGTVFSKAPVSELSVPMMKPELRGVVLADFTLGDLAARLRSASESPSMEVVETPFGQVMQQLLQAPPDGAADFAVIWSRPELVSPSFAALLHHEPTSEAALRSEVDAHVARTLEGAAAYRFVFVPTWSAPPGNRGLGILDARPPLGITWALGVMNSRLIDGLASAPNVHVLNAQRWLEAGGATGSTAKAWYLGKVRYQGEVLAEAARDLKAAVRAVTGQARKLVVVDLDETLWGGVVGDAGWENLRLGGHDPEGEALVDFQRALKDLTRRGIVLAIASKNDEAIALEAIGKHPEMVLRKDDFVGWRINWNDKARNIAELAQELNLGLQSVVFLDDNPVERARVREALPEVLVPDWPADKLAYPDALRSLRCFDSATLSREDAERTQLYAAERKRENLKRDVGDLDRWLKSLEIRVNVEPLGPGNLPRTTQLFNKTNQLNLSTRRMSEAELASWAAAGHRMLWAVSVGDRFGEAGLTGVVGVELDGELARIIDFILSCRVMGRRVENALVHLAVEWARTQGARRIEARHLPTAKNKPTLEFWRGSGFTAGEGGVFSWDASRPYPLPDVVQLARSS